MLLKVFCPLSMTDGTARVIELMGSSAMKNGIFPRLIRYVNYNCSMVRTHAPQSRSVQSFRLRTMDDRGRQQSRLECQYSINQVTASGRIRRFPNRNHRQRRRKVAPPGTSIPPRRLQVVLQRHRQRHRRRPCTYRPHNLRLPRSLPLPNPPPSPPPP